MGSALGSSTTTDRVDGDCEVEREQGGEGDRGGGDRDGDVGGLGGSCKGMVVVWKRLGGRNDCFAGAGVKKARGLDNGAYVAKENCCSTASKVCQRNFVAGTASVAEWRDH